MQSTVKVGGVLAGLMSRLAKYAADVPAVVPQFQSEDAFGKFSDAISKVIAAQPEIATVDVVSMYSSLMMFALQVHREQISYVDTVLSGCATALRSRGMVSEPKVGARVRPAACARLLTPCTPLLRRPQATKQIVGLLTAPLDAYNVVLVLSLSSYPKARLPSPHCPLPASHLRPGPERA
jgi:vacuolar protein sorting-associated protein 35